MLTLLVCCCTKTYVGFNGSAKVRWDKISFELVMKTNICTETKFLLRSSFFIFAPSGNTVKIVQNHNISNYKFGSCMIYFVCWWLFSALLTSNNAWCRLCKDASMLFWYEGKMDWCKGCLRHMTRFHGKMKVKAVSQLDNLFTCREVSRRLVLMHRSGMLFTLQ